MSESRSAAPELGRHRVASLRREEFGLPQAQAADQRGLGDDADRSTGSIAHDHNADLSTRQQGSHFDRQRVGSHRQ